ncbi:MULTISPECIES: cytochrome c [unclassified Bradyrhizobium]|uniref:c-type cytochrome n=1 Tax=unclassified Bradyrhizobium TaxID=2631580 RepID=UPI00247A7AD5|nr:MULTISPECIES: cytochrome c [unclassified Bradyrhizobium]WGS19739.1 cytochrome c [Bradyrhizobium sp. ISRA463]WGS26583.1 cytochrome c [Bradyrhizobium sp. ISRA464]
MNLKWQIVALLPVMALAYLADAMPALAQQQPQAQQPGGAAGGNENVNGEVLFASTCGFCHSDGGRQAGKGPQLMNDSHDDDFLRNRIKNGKAGAMPAFGATFSDAQIDEIIKYIRGLKPHEG